MRFFIFQILPLIPVFRDPVWMNAQQGACPPAPLLALAKREYFYFV
jgi:hypothetical protein